METGLLKEWAVWSLAGKVRACLCMTWDSSRGCSSRCLAELEGKECKDLPKLRIGYRYPASVDL